MPVSNSIQNMRFDQDRLVLQLQQGDEVAYQVLVRRFQKKLFAVAYGITLDREESMDIVQEVFIQVYRRIHTFKGNATLSTWLHRITVNHCLNWKRKWARRFKWRHSPIDTIDDKPLDKNSSAGISPEMLYEGKELGHKIENALKSLPEQARAVFVLRELEGLSYDEIAETLTLKKGTVKSRIFYARQKLKELLQPYASGESNG